MNRKISIIMPVYNAEKTLKRSVESVLNQTYKNIELILVNDGSTDESGKICLEYQKKDSRIKYLYQKNSGVSSARNKGIKLASSEFIAFLDADDYLDCEFCRKMLNSLNSEKSDMCICMNYNVRQYLNSDGVIEEKIETPEHKPRNKISIKSEEYDFYDNCSHWTVWGVLFRKKLMDNVRFKKGLFVGEDTYFLAEIIKKARRITFLDECLVYYILGIESASHGGFNSKKITEISSWKKIIELYKDRKEQVKNIKAGYAKRCIKLIKTYYVEDDNFKKNYYKKIISEYRKNAVYAFREDIKKRDYIYLIKHISGFIVPEIMFRLEYMKNN
ncbi:MAG: glycosyltransferase [Ruminococcus flavefaciens]|nr:glycosyltransferase [Ruminococcus flavefaciens]